MADEVCQVCGSPKPARWYTSPDHQLRDQLFKIADGAIRAAINNHGPITKGLSGCAAKRVAGQIVGWLRHDLSCPAKEVFDEIEFELLKAEEQADGTSFD